ncbi:MAG: cation:dicarboxylase symporter family transporter, partial [Proteobacteria bacterium]|nr:cation:dicarboxylase symporter family transporter [Pseudomonadota bacterium]
VAGGLAGLFGLNIVEYEPALQKIPDFFFGALPWFAAPYISLNIFRAFGEKEYKDWKHVRSEGGMVGRFLVIMGFSATISLATTMLMAKAGFLKPLAGQEPQSISRAQDAMQASGDNGSGMVNPSEYMPYIVPAALAGAVLYQFAKSVAKENSAQSLKKTFSAVTTWAGDMAITLAKGVDKAFFMYLNFVGVPATAVLMSQTLGGGFSKLAPFAGYYGTVLLNFAVSAAALAAAARSLNCRKKEFGGFARAMREAFFRSSSAMTLPVTKEALQGMGLSKDVRETVPVAGLSLNMAGVSQYLAATGMASLYLLDMNPTLGQALSVIGLSVAFSVGVPGAPASTIMLLDPVLSKVGLDNVQRAAIYKMVLPLDRIFDMFQTALNVGWDMVAAVHVDGGIKKKNGPEGPPDKNKGAADEATRLQPRP